MHVLVVVAVFVATAAEQIAPEGQIKVLNLNKAAHKM